MTVKKAMTDIDAVEANGVLETPKKAVDASDPWKKMVKIKLPKKEDGSPNYEIASVNGRVFKIKRGETVEVPAPIAEVLQHSSDAKDSADEFMESRAD